MIPVSCIQNKHNYGFNKILVPTSNVLVGLLCSCPVIYVSDKDRALIPCCYL